MSKWEDSEHPGIRSPEVGRVGKVYLSKKEYILHNQPEYEKKCPKYIYLFKKTSVTELLFYITAHRL